MLGFLLPNLLYIGARDWESRKKEAQEKAKRVEQEFKRGKLTAKEAAGTAQTIIKLRQELHNGVREVNGGQNQLDLLDLLFETPIINVRFVKNRLGVSAPTANSLVSKFEESGVLTEMTGFRRNRKFRFEPYLRLFAESAEGQPLKQPWKI